MLSALDSAARASNPTITLDADRFAAHLGARVGSEDDIAAALADIHAGDLFVACAALAGDAAATSAIDRCAAIEVRAALRNIDASPAFADEVRSLLLERLLVGEGDAGPKLASYSGLGPLSAWIRVAAMRTGISRKRKDRREVALADEDLNALVDRAPDAETVLLRGRYKDDFQAAFAEAVTALSPRDRNLLRLYYADGMRLDKLGAVYRVNASTVSRWIARAREIVLEKTRASLGARLRLDSAQLESLLGLAQSLDASLGGFLRGSAAETP